MFRKGKLSKSLTAMVVAVATITTNFGGLESVFASTVNKIDGINVSLDSLDNKYEVTGETITPVITITDDNGVDVEILDEDEAMLGGKSGVVITGEESASDYGEHVITLKGYGQYDGTEEIKWFISDSKAPTGKITVGKRSWTSLIKNIIFDTETCITKSLVADVEVEDGKCESGVDKAYYLVSENAVSGLESANWTELELTDNKGQIQLNENKPNVAYLKIVDKAGNVSYISSDGIITDTIMPVLKGVEDGGVYCGKSVEITITDDNFPCLLVDHETEWAAAFGGTYDEQDKVILKLDDEYEYSYEVINGTEYEVLKVANTTGHAGFTVIGHDTANFDTRHIDLYTEHDYGEYVYDDNATFRENGSETATCKHCGEKITREVPGSMLKEEYTTVKNEVVTVGNGEVNKDVDVDNRLDISASIPDEVIEDAFDEDEADEIKDNNGVTASIYLQIRRIDDSVSEDEKALIEEEVNKDSDKGDSSEDVDNKGEGNVDNDNKEIEYIDISLFKKLSNEEFASRITDTNGRMIDIELKLPDEFVNKDNTIERSYKIIRVHGGVAETIDAKYDKESQTVKFASDKFSTFALAYSDKVIEVESVKISVPNDKKEITVGGSIQLSASVLPENAANKEVEWTSSDESVAKISNTGLLESISTGEVTITVTSKSDNKISDSVKITVVAKSNSGNGNGNTGSSSGSGSGSGSGGNGTGGNGTGGSGTGGSVVKTPVPTLTPNIPKTDKPVSTDKPVRTDGSVVKTPVPTLTPNVTKTSEPMRTDKPVVVPTYNPMATTIPVPSETPVVTEVPMVTGTPVFVSSEPTEVVASETPVVTEVPVASEVPVVSSEPVESMAPVESSLPTVLETPSPTFNISKSEFNKNSNKMCMGLKVKQTKNNIIVTWGNVDADVYGVFVQYCGKNMCKIPIKLVKKNKAVIRKLNNRKINNVKSFKVYVVAYHNDNGKLVEIGKTLQGHYVGRDNIKYTNVYKVKTNKDKYVLSVGKKEKIKASTILKYKGRKELSDKHTRRFRYVTSNKDIVTVSKNGVMTAKSKGTCRVYVYARNMAVRVINVKVK